MLPKVANQLIHHTSRAVAAVQNQTGHTIRNVLQLQSSSGPSSVGNRNGPGSSSSGRGSGAGAGGARQSTSSSRFYNSYSVSICPITRDRILIAVQTFGRSVTQADPSTSLTLNSEAFDDVDDVPHTPSTVAAARLRRRTRTSLALHEREARAVKLGVVQALQQHLRAQHAFAAHPRSEVAQSDDARDAPPVVTEVQETPSNVTQHDDLLSDLKEALAAKDVQKVKEGVAKIRSLEQAAPTEVYNVALHALHEMRPTGEPLHEVLELYNDMVSRSVVPDSRTYGTLIVALTDRDQEVNEALAALLHRQSWWKQYDGFPVASRERLDERISYLRSEANFTSALTLFQASSMIPRLRLPRNVYVSLLNSCVEHGNLDAALLVFSNMEKRKDVGIPAVAYRHLIAIYTKTNDFQGAKEVFEEYKRRAQAGQVYLPPGDQVHQQSGVAQSRWGHVMVYNEMLTAYMVSGRQAEALALLEQMMDSSVDFTFADVPSPSAGTFTRIIDGFIRSGDVATANSWFMRLLDQQDTSKEDEDTPLSVTPQPSHRAWSFIIGALASRNMMAELNGIVDAAHRRGLQYLRRNDVIEIILANIRHVESLIETAAREDGVAVLDQLYARHSPVLYDWGANSTDIDDLIGVYGMFAKAYVKLGKPDVVLEMLEGFMSHVKAHDTVPFAESRADKSTWLRAFGYTHVRARYGDLSPSWSIKHALRLAATMRIRNMDTATAVYHLGLYINASEAQKDTLVAPEWSVLVHACGTLQNVKLDGAPHVDFFDLLADIFRRDMDLDEEATRRVATFLYGSTNPEESWPKMQALGPKAASLFQRIIDSEVTKVRMPQSEPKDIPVSLTMPPATIPIRIDSQQSRFVDEFTFGRSGVTATEAYTRFVDGAKEGRYPSLEVLGRVINALGRQGEREKVVELYKAAQDVLSTIQDKAAQLRSWAYIEDSMIIAFAHLENLDMAHLHRTRILQHGGCPSADAYGALIQRIKDTTDDTVSALALFQEAMANGVNPNIFLYNTIISKLAKARKADHALELFHDMRARSIRPTSVTYGAVIAACCRVGDAASAENLFEEMVNQPNFRPRVPPYNTMMQLYTHTKPDRERVLHYYNALLAAGVRPTAHTYKVCMRTLVPNSSNVVS